jgi:hypothetical protein
MDNGTAAGFPDARPFFGRVRRLALEGIAERLDIGRQAVYAMLEQKILPESGSGAGGSSRGTPTSKGSEPAERGPTGLVAQTRGNSELMPVYKRSRAD